MENSEVLALEMAPNDANAKTIKDYLKALLGALMSEQEGFSGKRPFGNSGWIGDLEAALVKGGAVVGTLDDDGWVETVDEKAALKIILSAIEAL